MPKIYAFIATFVLSPRCDVFRRFLCRFTPCHVCNRSKSNRQKLYARLVALRDNSGFLLVTLDGGPYDEPYQMPLKPMVLRAIVGVGDHIEQLRVGALHELADDLVLWSLYDGRHQKNRDGALTLKGSRLVTTGRLLSEVLVHNPPLSHHPTPTDSIENRWRQFWCLYIRLARSRFTWLCSGMRCVVCRCKLPWRDHGSPNLCATCNDPWTPSKP